jgi:ATP-dependent helicase/nuclease subunit A
MLAIQEPRATNRELPRWALRPIEKTQPSVVVMPPSGGEGIASATPDGAFARGRIIHRLLQSLPAVVPQSRPDIMKRFLSHPRYHLTQEQQDEIAREVSPLLSDKRFMTLFAADSLTEAPVTGTLNGTPVFRQIDRLCFYNDEVWIVDYKTNRPPPQNVADVPRAYCQQLNEYRALLSDIYPNKKVRCFLLWTYAPQLMEIPLGKHGQSQRAERNKE